MFANVKKGLLISFEGGEGAGKSTQIPLVKAAIEAMGQKVMLTREPGGTPLGEKIRHMLKHDPDGKDMVSQTELLLFLAARAQNYQQLIVPTLEQGCHIICDRFIDSSVVYQGFVRGLGMERVAEFNDFATLGNKPDLTFILDVPVEMGLRRVRERDGEIPALWDRLDAEAQEFHEKVREGYLKLAKSEPNRFVLIETAEKTIEAITEEIMTHVRNSMA